jgi:GNAT superfamily N-acetyltransferase
VVADLVEAFMDDPVFSWVFPDRRRRHRYSRAFFDLHARRSIVAGFAWRTDGGAALWAPPGAWRTSTMEDLLLSARTVRGTGVRHGRRVVRHLIAVERQHPTDPHLQLAVLGLRPERQGLGLGGPLIAPGLAYADEHRLPCYLESSNPRNLAFYERHGFEVTGDHPVPGGPVITFMWRKAG